MVGSRLVMVAVLVAAAASATCSEEQSACSAAAEASEGEVVCGVHRQPDDDPCRDPVNAEACASQTANNDAVTACVLQAVSDGAPFQYRHLSGDADGQFGATSTFHVTADGTVWRELTESADLCSTRSTDLYETVVLDDCADLDCVRNRLLAAELVDECSQSESCEGL